MKTSHKHPCLTYLLFSLLLISRPGYSESAPTELLTNPGLELDEDQNGLPDGWAFLESKGNPLGTRSLSVHYRGSASAEAFCASKEDIGYWSQVVRIKRGMKRFRLKASMRTAGEAQANVSFSAYEFKTNKWLAAKYDLLVAKSADRWKTQSAEFEVPDRTGSVRIALWCNYGRKGHGRTWFDGISLEALDYERAPAIENMAANADFEALVADSGLPAQWPFNKVRGNARPLRECPEPRAGKAAAGIAVEAGGSGLVFQWAPVAQGWEIYELSAWVKTSGQVRALGSLSVYTEDRKKWLAAGYKLFNAAGSREWRRFTGYYQAPPIGGYLKIALWAESINGEVGQVWFDDIQLKPVEAIPPKPYLPSNPLPGTSGEERSRGFIVFNRNPLDLMPPTYIPSDSERKRPLSLSSAKGRREHLSIGIFALEDLKNMKLEVSELRSKNGDRIAAGRIRVRVVKYLVKRSHYGMNDRVVVPTYLEAADSMDVTRGRSGQFWITVTVPPESVSGNYEGIIQLTGNKGKAQATLPFRVNVQPFQLDPPGGMSFGLYDGQQRTVPGQDFLYQKYLDMRSHGMTTVGYCGNLGVEMQIDKGEVKVSFQGESGFEKAMDSYRRADFPEPVVWLMGSDVRRFSARQGQPGSEEFRNAYQGVIRAVLKEASRREWSEIIFQPEDEVFAHASRFELAFTELKLLKEIKGVRTEMDGTNVRPQLAKQTYPFTDVLVHCYGPMTYGRTVFPRKDWLAQVKKIHADGKKIWFYNVDTTGYHIETMRFAAGLYTLWSNADGLLSWAYSWGDADPYDDYSGPRGDTVFYYPPRGRHKGGPALGLIGLQMGIDDYRYARALLNRIREAERGEDKQQVALAAAARSNLEGWLNRLDLSKLRTNRSMQGDWSAHPVGKDGLTAVSGSFKLNVGIGFEDYNRFRSMCSTYIMKMGKQ